VILDNAKSYVTVDLSFFFRLLAAPECGRPMLHFIRLLLSDTLVNTALHGHVSKAQVWQAGVLQGCSLTRLFYLCVEEALACWLGQCPELGVLVANQRRVSRHYAKVFLSSLQPDLVQSLVVRLDTCFLASVQSINLP
jgi:hypothetical protein